MSIADKLTTVAENEPKVFEAGKKAQNKEFWDDYLCALNNNNDAFNYFAGYGWNARSFYPTQHIKPRGNATTMFGYCSRIRDFLDLAGRLDECKVKLDTSGVTHATQMFTMSGITHIPKLDFTNVTATFDRVFNNCTRLTKIDEWVMSTKANAFNTPFNGCTELTDLTISGTIYRSFDCSPCPLTPESMKSVINALADYSSENTGKYTVSFNSTCWTVLEADSTAPDGGTWKDYVYYTKGWNY